MKVCILVVGGYQMKNDFRELETIFKGIKNKGWIKGITNTKGNVGLTFENLLDKEAEDFPMPDFKSVEIKTYEVGKQEIIHLFNLTPDGDYLFPIKRILNELGCPDKEKKECRIFYRELSAVSYTNIGLYKKAKLIVNYPEQKVEMHVFNNYNKDINIGVSWSFSAIEERLNLKLKNLALVTTFGKYLNGDKYFKYNSINFYQIKDFLTFLLLIKTGYIHITFKIGVFKNGRREGQIYDHGTDFSISVENIEKLYDKIEL